MEVLLGLSLRLSQRGITKVQSRPLGQGSEDGGAGWMSISIASNGFKDL